MPQLTRDVRGVPLWLWRKMDIPWDCHTERHGVITAFVPTLDRT
jgi:hypothetical protein